MLTIKCFKNFFLFLCHNNNSTWRLPIATPPPPTHHVHEGRRPRREAFMKSSTTLFVFNGKIFVQRGTRGRLTATRLPGTHPSTPPPLDSDSVALAVLLFSRVWRGTGCSACSSWFCWGLFISWGSLPRIDLLLSHCCGQGSRGRGKWQLDMPSKLKIKATSALSTNKSVRQFHYLTVKRDKLCRKSSQRDPRTSKHSKEEGRRVRGRQKTNTTTNRCKVCVSVACWQLELGGGRGKKGWGKFFSSCRSAHTISSFLSTCFINWAAKVAPQRVPHNRKRKRNPWH